MQVSKRNKIVAKVYNTLYISHPIYLTLTFSIYEDEMIHKTNINNSFSIGDFMIVTENIKQLL